MNTRKKTEKQEKYIFPKENSDFIYQITTKELIPIVWNGADFSEQLEINHGDILLYHPTNELDENQLTLWKPRDNELLSCGFAYENFDEIGIINPFFEDSDESYKKRDVSLVGVIVGIVKPYDARKVPNFQYEIQSEEITAVCGKCKAELKGTSGFIKSQGWKLRKDETLCLNCDLEGEK